MELVCQLARPVAKPSFQSSEGRTGLSSRQQARTGWGEDSGRLDTRVNENTHEAILHLVPILVSPDDKFVGIGIVLVVRRVVVVSNSDYARTLRQELGFRKVISHLPIEVPFRLENRFRLS